MVKYNREKRYEHLKRWAESGLSGQEYCRQHEIPPTTFYSWKKAEENLEEQTKMNTEMEPAERFVPVRNTVQGFPDQGAITIKLHDIGITLPLTATADQIERVLTSLRVLRDA